MEIKLKNYIITRDSLQLEGEARIPEALIGQLEKLHKEVQKPKSKTIDRLLKLIKRYPNNVQLRNYLAIAYSTLGRKEASDKVNDGILKNFPDYLFAKINKAQNFYEEEAYEEMKDILGERFNLKALYPKRDLFHISEFMVMENMAVKYFLGIEDFEQADKRLALMEEIDSDAPQLQQAKEEHSNALLKRAKKRFIEEQKQEILPVIKYVPKIKDFVLPKFNFEITKELYVWDIDIPEEILQEILENNREKTIEDLKNVIKDSVYNYEEYASQDWSEETRTFTMHALYLLSDLQAEESLSLIVEMMQQGEEYFEENFGDSFTETGWIPLFNLGKNQIELLVDYLKLPGIYTFYRTSVIDALVQIVHHSPDKKEEVIKAFDEILSYFLRAKLEDNVIDTEFNGLFISDLMDLHLSELLPKIKQLYDKGYVNPGISGTYEEVEERIKSDKPRVFGKRERMNIFEVYQYFLTPLSYPQKPHSFSEESSYPKLQNPAMVASKKIGRNDPCPCGSGKKYKKCCLN